MCSESVEEEEKINGCIYCIAVVGKAVAGSWGKYNIYMFFEKKETAVLTIVLYTYSEKRYN